MTPSLRPYQLDVLERARARLRQGARRVLIQAPTGAGKTHVSSELMRCAVAKNKRGLFLAHRRRLVQQKCERLGWFGVPHGVLMAGESTCRSAPVQVASRDTLLSRGLRNDWMSLPPADVVVVDEAHTCLSEQYQALLARYPDAAVIGLTATPARADGRGLGSYFDALECTVGTSRLVREGWLVPVRCYAPERKGARAGKRALRGDPVAHWKRHARGRPTVLFAPKVEASLAACEAFKAAGVPAAHIDAHTPDEERDEVDRKLRSGELTVVCNCNVWCLDQRTEILTSAGWVGIDQMSYQHKVANWDQGRVYFKEPKFIIRRDREEGERMVTLGGTRTGMDIRVTDRHRMLYRTARGGDYRIKRAAELVGKRVTLPLAGTAEPTVFDRSAVEPGQALPHELTLHECELIGFWLGDGSVDRLKKGGVEYKIHQVAYHVTICARIQFLLDVCGIDSIRRSHINAAENLAHRWSLPRGTGSGSQARRGVYRIEPYLSKSGTPLFAGLSREQFDALMRGLWMADGIGHHDHLEPPLGRVTVCGVGRELFDCLQAVAVCRGLSASIRTSKAREVHHRPLLYLSVSPQDKFMMGKYRLQFEAAPSPRERVWCVTSESGNIITRRNGRVVVTGNTEGTDIPELSCCVLLRLAGSYVLFAQAVGRVMRAHPGKAEAVLIDHSGAVYQHGFPDEDVSWALDEGDSVDRRVRAEKEAGKRRRPVTCPACGFLFDAAAACPACGHKLARRQLPAKLQSEVLVEARRHMSADDLRAEQASYWRTCLYTMAAKGRTAGAAAHMFKSRFGDWPADGLPDVPRGQQWKRAVVDLFPQYGRRAAHVG